LSVKCVVRVSRYYVELNSNFKTSRFPNLILQYLESYLINIGVCVDSESITRVFKYTLE